ncbi:putative permease [Spathaspora passalidarum NRRL Y-27907]|uniref:Putative permease n=1 Tax=Spathaspora passalidarum (strain NRRL Y-27907 / 11-Y1) TaxID=619300 RepID=G3AGU4_SPAPN|nr:putative permease [Spathaspora passalidarum NRRL Y-27907]EGW35426.1 putative permease [Spathaspora passalidarum NRRL Y-27907]
MTQSYAATVFSRLKWGIFPTRRIVDEDENGNFIYHKHEVDDSSESFEKSSDKNVVEIEVKDSTVLEYRDEKDRPWWKFFDEYEYRVNKETKSNRKWYHWFHEDDTPEERRVILKIDLLLTFYSLMAYWVKYLDQTNLTNAYVGGLKEAINMQGNDFVNTGVMFSVGNIIFQIPFMYILYAVPLNYVLPALDLCWSILTVCLYRVENVATLKALRFLIGAFEAPSYLAYHALFASWFKGSTAEISRRAGFYYLGQYLGVLTSGLLSGAIARTMGGVHGLQSWQWIFIIDGIISVVVGFIGFYMIPGTPEDCYSIFLSDDDIRIARRRMIKDQKDHKPRENAVKHFFNAEIWKSIFTSWHFYVLCLWNIFCWNNSNAGSGSYALWLKSLTNADGSPRFGPGQLQDYTALTPGLGLIWLIITCSFADLFKSRSGAILFSQVFNVIGNVLLAVWHIPEGAKWFAFCLQYFGWAMAPVLYSWQGDICRKDIRERQVVLVSMNILAQQSTAWISVLVWPTVEAPRFLKGFSFTASSAVALSVWTIVVLWFYKREERANARENGIVLFDSSKGDIEDVKQ